MLKFEKKIRRQKVKQQEDIVTSDFGTLRISCDSKNFNFHYNGSLRRFSKVQFSHPCSSAGIVIDRNDAA